MSQQMDQISIPPVEEMIIDGLCKRFQQVFNCPVLHTNGYEKVTALKEALAGKQVEYPFALVTVKGMSQNNESWSSHELARRGLQVVIQARQGQAWKVKLLPTNFDLEIEYHTNTFMGKRGCAVRALSRWLFARRLGFLKFNVEYGRLVLNIGNSMTEAPDVPERESIAEGESVYKIPFSMTIHGYVSQPELQRQGIVKEVIQTGQLFRAFPTSGA